MLLSRKEILENHHNSAQGQILEHEINIRKIESIMLTTSPGETYAAMEKALVQRQSSIAEINEVMKIVETMIEEEEKNEQKV